jgi:tetratricopeptide (TPR) repeat protein
LIGQQIDAFLEKDDWNGLIGLLTSFVSKDPDDHWLLAYMALAYYEKQDYDTALDYVTKAMALDERCPVVLWQAGLIFKMKSQKQVAIALFQEIIDRGWRSVAFDLCCSNYTAARSLVADCKYMISMTYKELGNRGMAEVYKKAYRDDVKKGVKTGFNPYSI